VKPDNFLVGGDDGATVKLCDFGLSGALPSEGEKKGLLKGVYGTAPFMCPEMIKGKYYDGRADVWSVGVLAYALLFGTFPYSPKVATSKAMKQAVVEGKPPSFSCIGQSRSDSAVEFVKTLLERSSDERPSATDALRLPYLQAVRENRHMGSIELPSLRQMVYTAKKAGAFKLRDLTKEADIDPLLNKKQQEKHGMSLPEKSLEKKIPGKTGGNQSKGTKQFGDWQITISNMSVNSKVWDNTSSFATTASANSSLRGTTLPSDCSSPEFSNTCSSPTLSARTDSA
jgi:serine/threonine protein kinase